MHLAGSLLQIRVIRSYIFKFTVNGFYWIFTATVTTLLLSIISRVSDLLITLIVGENERIYDNKNNKGSDKMSSLKNIYDQKCQTYALRYLLCVGCKSKQSVIAILLTTNSRSFHDNIMYPIQTV